MKHRGDKAFRPSFEDMTQLTGEMEDMHKRVDPQEEPIPTLIAPYEIDDSVPTEDEITLAVKLLANQIPPFSPSPTLNLIHERDLRRTNTATSISS